MEKHWYALQTHVSFEKRVNVVLQQRFCGYSRGREAEAIAGLCLCNCSWSGNPC